MLPKQYRLPKNVFQDVFRKGKRLGSPELQYIIAPNALNSPRFAVVVGLKISKKAVVRNRIKRLIRESLQHILPSLSQSINCIILVKSDISDKNTSDIETLIRRLLKNYLP